MSTTDTPVCTSSESVYLERVRFFPGQLITPDDLTQDQQYFRSKLRRHNRFLHGWGIVCGAGVTQGPKPSQLVVSPGYVLGPYGDEIVIAAAVTVDVCAENVTGNAFDCADGGSDPWCGDVRVNRRAGQPLYLAVKYSECQSRPVRAYPATCGCSEGDCEYSRIQDGFAIKVLTALPSSYNPMPRPVDGTKCPDQIVNCGRPCPPCPSDPWVILTDFTVSADCSIASIDCLAHRRFVATNAYFYFQCSVPTGTVGTVNTVATPAITGLGTAPDDTTWVQITVDNPVDAQIYYTTDGSDPSPTSAASTLFGANNDNIPVPYASLPLTVKAIGVRAGWQNSAIASAVITHP